MTNVKFNKLINKYIYFGPYEFAIFFSIIVYNLLHVFSFHYKNIKFSKCYCNNSKNQLVKTPQFRYKIVFTSKRCSD